MDASAGEVEMHMSNEKAKRSLRPKYPFLCACSAVMAIGLANSSHAQDTPPTPQAASQEAPEAPARPKSLLDMPPSQPQVSCGADKLTIKADNATLGSVLSAVASCIGTKIEVPDGAAAAERLYTQFGPGPVKDTLAALFSSVEYDFVISTSPSNPQKVETVLLMRRSVESAPAIAESGGGSARHAWAENRRNAEAAMRAAREEAGQPEPEPAEAATAPTTAAAPAENASADPPQTPATPADTPPAATASSSNATTPAAAAAAAASGAQGKNTQDLISDMRQLFEQRRQMIQGQKASPQ